nr:enoyl-CoA hydratase/isomerase family protein [Aestuariibacter sp. A3R04]
METENTVAFISFSRSEQLNAMNSAMMDEIIHALNVVNGAQHSEIKVCVVTGIGRAFMAGADIKEYAAQTEQEFSAFQAQGKALYSAIENNTKPVVAAVNGYAFGGGFEIALACDMIVASEWAKFALPEIKLALIPGGGGTQRLAMKLGRNLANELLMTGKAVDANWLCERGLVNTVVPKSEDFMDQVKRFVAPLQEANPDCLTAIKQLTLAASGDVKGSQLMAEQRLLAQFYNGQESKKRIAEFVNKGAK